MGDGAIMHLDGCHFYVWVTERDGVQSLVWNERRGSDLFLHKLADCARCSALRNGAEPQEGIALTLDPPLPLDGKAAFVRILEVIADDARMIA